MISLLRISLVTVLCFASTSCTASYPTEPTKARPVALYLAYALPKGRAAPGTNNVTNGYSFTAYTIDADGVYERVSERAAWSSSDEGIVRLLATPSSAISRSFLAVSPGSANVTARFEGLEATAPVLIVESTALSTRPFIQLSWSGQNAVGTQSSARVLYVAVGGANQDVTGFASWTSSDPDVATVDSRGVIRAVSSGTTIITATIDGLLDWFWFSVVPKS